MEVAQAGASSAIIEGAKFVANFCKGILEALDTDRLVILSLISDGREST